MLVVVIFICLITQMSYGLRMLDHTIAFTQKMNPLKAALVLFNSTGAIKYDRNLEIMSEIIKHFPDIPLVVVNCDHDAAKETCKSVSYDGRSLLVTYEGSKPVDKIMSYARPDTYLLKIHEMYKKMDNGTETLNLRNKVLNSQKSRQNLEGKYRPKKNYCPVHGWF
ncbi:hypothetical protein ACOME3_007001 [Neoechinorhynchus agilis]